MNLKKYILTTTQCEFFKAVFEVDIDHPELIPACRETNDFFLGAEDRLEQHDGDLVSAYFELLGRPLWFETVRSSGVLGKILREFNDNVEGFYPLDGSKGIKLIEIDSGYPESHSFDLHIS